MATFNPSTSASANRCARQYSDEDFDAFEQLDDDLEFDLLLVEMDAFRVRQDEDEL